MSPVGSSQDSPHSLLSDPQPPLLPRDGNRKQPASVTLGLVSLSGVCINSHESVGKG